MSRDETVAIMDIHNADFLRGFAMAGRFVASGWGSDELIQWARQVLKADACGDYACGFYDGVSTGWGL